VGSCAQVRQSAHRANVLLDAQTTVPAVQGALSSGYTHVELDVRLLADGTAALHHDALIGRVVFGDGEQRLSALRGSDWKRLTLRHPDGSVQTPNVLSDVLPILSAHPSATVLLEIKATPACAQVEALVRQAEQALPQRVRFASLSTAVLACVRQVSRAPVVLVFAPKVTDTDLQRSQAAQSMFAKDLERYGVSKEQSLATLRRAYAQNGNWDLLGSDAPLHSALRPLAPASVLLDAPMLMEHAPVLSKIQALGYGIGTYSAAPAGEHAQYLHEYARTVGRWVDEWVSDGNPSDLCALKP
jgi:glycerophosphoryl diester phosphodiesterase